MLCYGLIFFVKIKTLPIPIIIILQKIMDKISEVMICLIKFR